MSSDVQETSEELENTRSLVEEMTQSYVRYAMSVNVGRHLPDVCDGLKPVQRRILYAMGQRNMGPGRPRQKCAAVVGEVMGSFHPHGDSPIYEALVRMAQPFNTRYLMVDSQGNFGSIDGDPPAAMRYTECRLTAAAMAMLEDIEKDTVNMRPNYDEKHEEPVVLPAKLPNLLINGGSGIGVAMATNIPPHNLGEVVDALLLLIDEPKASIEQIIKVLPGPDFPTGGLVLGGKGIRDAYETGRGSITIQGRADIDEENRAIVITELPFQVGKEALIRQIAKLVLDRKIEGVSNVNDETDRTGMRIVVEMRRDAEPKVILNQLYKHTSLRNTFGILLLALVKNKPQVLSVSRVLKLYIEHRLDVIRRRTKYELKRAEDRAHLLEGLRIISKNIDDAIALIRSSDDRAQARDRLMNKFNLDQIQADAVLAMTLGQLTRLDQQRLDEEYRELTKQIKELREILSDKKRVEGIMKVELKEIKRQFGDARRTTLDPREPADLSVEDLLEVEDLVVTITRDGYVKRLPLSTYRVQKRGGRGIIALSKKEEDFVAHLFTATTHHTILFFTNNGKYYHLKAYEVPVASRQARGTPIVNLVPLEPGERIVATVPIPDFAMGGYLFMATQRGRVKKTALTEFRTRLTRGVQAMGIHEGDGLGWVRWTDGEQDIVLVTCRGMVIRFAESGVRGMGRLAAGVRGIRLSTDDSVAAMSVTEQGADQMLVATQAGYGKRTHIKDVRSQARGGKGVIGIKVNDKTGEVVALRLLQEDDQILLITTNGVIIRQKVKEIRRTGRVAQGVRLVRLDEGDTVGDCALIANESLDN